MQDDASRTPPVDPMVRLGRRLTPPISCAVLTLAVLLVWGRSIGFDFVWDDHEFIRKLQSIRSLRNVPAMFYDINAQASDGPKFRVFRPLRTLQYAILFRLGGGRQPNPRIFHAANVIWHLAAILLFYGCLRRLLSRPGDPAERNMRARAVALAAALGAAVHPLAAEVVCWCKSLDDLMAAVFTLAALLVLLRNAPLPRAYPWAVAFYALAVYSKVSAIPFLFVAPAVLYLVLQRPLREVAARTVPFAAVAAIYLFHRYGVLGRMEQIPPLSGSWIQTVIDTVATAPTYARLFLGAPPFCIDYAWWPRGASILSARVLGGIGLIVAGSAAAVVLLQRRRSRVAVTAGLGLLWTAVFFLPVSNIVPMMQYIAERFAYLPLYGVLLVFGAGVMLLSESPWRRVTGLVFCLPLVWGFAAFWRAGIWRDDLTLFFTSTQTCPSQRLRTNAVRSILELPYMAPAFKAIFPADKVDWERVDQTLTFLDEKFPNHPDLLTAKAIAALRRGRVRDAGRFIQKTLPAGGEFYTPWYALACIDLACADYEAAKRHVLEAFRRAPSHPNVLFLVVCYYKAVGNEDAARRMARRLPNPDVVIEVADHFLHELRTQQQAAAGLPGREHSSPPAR